MQPECSPDWSPTLISTELINASLQCVCVCVCAEYPCPAYIFSRYHFEDCPDRITGEKSQRFAHPHFDPFKLCQATYQRCALSLPWNLLWVQPMSGVTWTEFPLSARTRVCEDVNHLKERSENTLYMLGGRAHVLYLAPRLPGGAEDGAAHVSPLKHTCSLKDADC